jgi:hypothetical protein
MNYLKLYTQLVTTRKQTRNVKKEVNYEVHHIIPRCLGGSDCAENLVKLTYREHFFMS